MNKINFNQTGGFPLDTDVLDFMQNAYSVFNALGEMAGHLAILKGCEITGNSVSDGVVFIQNEVLPFKGGSLGDSVIIKEERKNLTFEDGQEKEVEIIRYATFGNGILAYNWADFFRIKDNKTLQKEIFKDENSLEKRLENLEEKLRKTLPIGLVAIWDRPADQIPEGWVEHTEMQGFTPVGQKQNDTDFGRLGKTLGSKTHTLTLQEMPRHTHSTTFTMSGDHDADYNSRMMMASNEQHVGSQSWETNSAGESRAHNNIQPSRIVRFIRFVGW